MVFSVQSATEATIGHLEIAIVAKKEETATGQSYEKAMVELFFNACGNVHMEFIPEGATVNKHHYKEILRHLHNSIHYKCPEL
jgi:hypothetical protein